MDVRNLLIGILLMAVTFLGVRSCSSEAAYNKTVAAKESQLIKWRDKTTGAESAKRQVIETTKKDLLQMDARAYKDSVIIEELQRQVKKAPRGTRSVSVVTRSISGKASGGAIVSTENTTAQRFTNNDSTFTATVTTTPDSSYLEYAVKDTLIVTQYQEKGKLFFQIENKNPAVEITGLRTYQVKERKRYTGLKILGGFLLGAGTIIYVTR